VIVTIAVLRSWYIKLLNKQITMKSKQQQIEELKQQLTGDMIKDMDIKDKIHNLEMEIKGVKPEDSHFDCIGCGS